MNTLGSRVRFAREKLGLGSNELDRRIGKPQGYTSRIESGQRPHPRPENVQALAAALEVTIEWLVTGKSSAPEGPLPPNLAPIAATLRAHLYPDWLIRQAAVFFEAHEDLSPEQWRDYIDGLRREARRMELEVVAAKVFAETPAESKRRS